MAEETPDLDVHWIVFSAAGRRILEAQRSARDFLRNAARKKIVLKQFRTSFFPFEGKKIKEFFETLKSFDPDLVLTHYGDDRHQDHRLLSDLSWNTFRNHFILEYEVPKYDGDLGIPNLFIPLSEGLAREKVGNVGRHFQTQSNKHWFSRTLSSRCCVCVEWNVVQNTRRRFTPGKSRALEQHPAGWRFDPLSYG